MKTCDEMVNSLFQRREEYLAQQKIKRRNAVISAALYCCAFAAVVGLGVWIKGEISQKPVTVDPSAANPGSTSVIKTECLSHIPIVWASKPGNYRDIIVEDDIDTEWNGKRISGMLRHALDEGGEDCLYAVEARVDEQVFHNAYEAEYGEKSEKMESKFIDEQFVYNGKTLAQYEAERGEKSRKMETGFIIDRLLEAADSLEIENGDKISKDIYDKIVSYIKERISKPDIEEKISEYIVDGIFLKDKAVQYTTKAEEEWKAAVQAENQARKACRAHFYKEVGKQLEAKGIENELIYKDTDPEDFLDDGHMSDYLLLFISKEDFANLTLDNMSDWIFCHAYNDTEPPIVWYEGFGYDDDIITVFGNKSINSSLWEFCNEEHNNCLYAIEAQYTSIDKQFVYNGKTLAEYEAEEEEQERRVNSLHLLLQEGEYLINNKDEYPSMLPEAKKFYEDTIAEIGEDLMSEYIVNGVFLKEKASQDFAKAEEDWGTAQRAYYDQACAAYRAYVYEKTAKQLEAQGIKCVYSSDPDYLLLFISRDDFAKLELDNMSEWFFVHASKDIYVDDYRRIGGYTLDDLPDEE